MPIAWLVSLTHGRLHFDDEKKDLVQEGICYDT